MKFKGKTAVITGSGRREGLGEAIAQRLAKDGANIVISDIGKSRDAATGAEHIGSTDEMESIADELRGMGVEASTCVCDVRSLVEVRKLAKHASETHGSLDIWVNNAGIGYIMKPLLDVTEDDWRAVIDVNLSGSFFGVKSAAEIMIEQGQGGRIINIASQAAKSGFPHAQAYTSSKHGLVGLARSAAVELYDRVGRMAERIFRQGRRRGQCRGLPRRYGRAYPDGPSRLARRYGQCRGFPLFR